MTETRGCASTPACWATGRAALFEKRWCMPRGGGDEALRVWVWLRRGLQWSPACGGRAAQFGNVPAFGGMATAPGR